MQATSPDRRASTLRRILGAAWRLSGQRGLTGWTLRDLAAEVGMRAPSLYGYVASKHALYDAMFADGYRALLLRAEGLRAGQPPAADHPADHPAEQPADDHPAEQPGGAPEPREALRRAAHLFVSFCVEDPARYQLLFLRTIPGFEPSPPSYALARRTLELAAEALAAAGFPEPADLDLWTAVTTGLATQQISNDPGGHRWTDLVDRAVDRFLAAG